MSRCGLLQGQSSVDGNRLKRKLTDMSGERKQRRVDPVNRGASVDDEVACGR